MWHIVFVTASPVKFTLLILVCQFVKKLDMYNIYRFIIYVDRTF